jgi:glycyl-tRNA synthetase beta chain
MNKDLLLEIGTEEVPAHFMPGILQQIADTAKKVFTDLRLSYEDIRTVGTPRRMTLLIKGLNVKQADIQSENKGPSVKIAFDAQGNPTKAYEGFARGQKIDVKTLEARDGYVYAIVHEKGRDTEKLLQEVLPNLIHGLNFPKNMHWADLDVKFVRPIRWIVALFDDAVIDFTIANVRSGRISRGHRFLSQGDFSIERAADYETLLKEQYVIVDQTIRRSMIRQQIEKLAAAKGGKADITEELLEEVVFLVEYPTALCGSFSEKYLLLPQETVITPMREHQRYFPVLAADGKLMPMFITVRNGGSEHLETVQHGNERVLRARLDDAQFFFDEDRKVKLVDRLEKLKTVVFQEGLGSVYDKTIRLEKLAIFLGKAIGASPVEIDTSVRAAKLAKTDLVSGMVCEFTELQGVMGREYASLEGETKETAAAIYEHYLPRFAGDVLPPSTAGRIVSIADKIDNIVATFSRGLIPTGSQDPFALRRQALGLVNILIDAKYTISLANLVNDSMDLFGITDPAARSKMLFAVEDFLRLRVKNVLADAKIRYDIADAVISGGVFDVYSVYLKAKALSLEIDKEPMEKAIQAFVRVANLAKKAPAVSMNAALFTLLEEKALYQAYTSTASAVESLVDGQDYSGAIDALMDLTTPIDVFFAGVMVMDKDETIKNNRLALLKSILELISQVADFSKIV